MKKILMLLLASCSFTLAMSLNAPKDMSLPTRVRAMVAWVQQNKMRLGAAAAVAAGLYGLRRSYTGWRHDPATAWSQLKKGQRAGYRVPKKDTALWPAVQAVLSPAATSFERKRAARQLVMHAQPRQLRSLEERAAMVDLLSARCGGDSDKEAVPFGAKVCALHILGRQALLEQRGLQWRTAAFAQQAEKYNGPAGALVSTSSDPGSAGYASLAERKRHSPYVD